MLKNERNMNPEPGADGNQAGGAAAPVQQGNHSEAFTRFADIMGGLPGAEEIKQELAKTPEPKDTTGAKPEDKTGEPESEQSLLMKRVAEKAAANGAENKTEDPNANKTASAADGNAPDADKQKEAEALKITSPIFGGEKEISTEAKNESPIKVDDTVKGLIKDKFGVDDPNKFFEVAQSWRKDSQDLAKVSKEAESYKQIFEKIPEELYEGIVTWSKGGDWKKAVNSRPDLDFNKGVDQYDPKTLIDTYFPGQFSKEDWDEYRNPDGNEKLKKAIDVLTPQAQKMFDTDRTKLANKRAEDANKQVQFKKNYDESIDRSVEVLDKSLPGVNAAYKAKLKHLMSSGEWKKLLFKDDGTFNENAALGLAMYADGHDLLQQYSKFAANRARTKAAEEMLNRTPEAGTHRGKAAGGNPEIRPEVLNYLNDLVPKESGRTY